MASETNSRRCDPRYAEAEACGFDPRDDDVWRWWCGLDNAARQSLAKLSDQSVGRIRTFSETTIRHGGSNLDVKPVRGSPATNSVKKCRRKSHWIAAMIRPTDAR